MPAHGALVENIKGSAANIGDQFNGTGDPDKNMPVAPKFRQTDSILEQSSWMKLAFPYTFSVQNIKTKAEVKQFTDFVLPLAPQSINQSEDFAIAIRPTQGGTTVTHSGNRYKTLSIKGTTGVHAFKGAGGALKSTGEAIFQPKELKYKSGYEVFLRLRNWFRAYYEFKKDNPAEARDLRLIFKNYKDGEFLIVECTNFEMLRQAARPFLYDYDLEFKVLAHLFDEKLQTKLAGTESKLASALEKLDVARGVILRTQDVLRQVEATYNAVVLEPLRKVSLTLKAIVALPTVAADIGNRIVNNTLSTLGAIGLTLGIIDEQEANRVTGSLDPRIANIKLPANPKAVIEVEGPGFINTFNEGLIALESSRFPANVQAALAEEQEAALRTPRSFFEQVIVDVTRVKQNLEDFLNLGDPAYDALFERSATLIADPTKVATVEEFELLNALNEVVQAISLILSTEALFKASLEARIDSLTEPFNGTLDLAVAPAVRQIIFQAGVSLEKLAQIELGDSLRWGEIAELNQLRAPYVTEDLSSTDAGLAKPGDRILIPTSITNGFSQVPLGKQTDENKDLSEVQKSLGTDLQLTDDFDLALTPGGDLAVISSIENMVQTVHLKLAYEQGDVIQYPELGAGVITGIKFPPLLTIQNGIISSLLQDARIERVDDLALIRNGSELKLSFNLKIKEVDLPVPLTIQLS